jgi:membrane protein DedA with SNARE-associated domain
LVYKNFRKVWILDRIFGSFIEGESIILAASTLAYFNYLSIYNVTLLAFLGSMLSDQICYLIGYRYGERFLSKFPKIQKHHDKVSDFLKRFEMLFIFGFRFVYGVRNVSPFIIGSSKIPMKKFFILNATAAFLWAVISCSLGYFLGKFILLLSPLGKFVLFGSVGFGFVLVTLWKIFIRKKI